jgi:hypothetical protein
MRRENSDVAPPKDVSAQTEDAEVRGVDRRPVDAAGLDVESPNAIEARSARETGSGENRIDADPSGQCAG